MLSLGAAMNSLYYTQSVPVLPIIVVAAFAVCISLAVGIVADKRGRSGPGWFFLSLQNLSPMVLLSAPTAASL